MNFERELKKIGKKVTVLAEVLDDSAKEQFVDVMSKEFVTRGALMPDAHGGYSMPIGGVVATQGYIVPQWVGFDIGCGMCAYKTDFVKADIEDKTIATAIHQLISEKIPTGFDLHPENQDFDYTSWNITDTAKEVMEKSGLKQIGTLGGGNHFIEIGYGDDDQVWIVIHSGSRGYGAKIATHYIDLPRKNEVRQLGEITEEKARKNISEEIQTIIDEQEAKSANIKKHNPTAYKNKLDKMISKAVKKELDRMQKEVNVPVDKLSKIYPLDVNSKLGQDYICDLNFGLHFALENRKRMITEVLKSMDKILGTKDSDILDENRLINRNHNHAEFNSSTGEWIHRKGATHAEKGMDGVIPGNMRDGSFIVKGKGNPDTLYSSSHGAGRILSRKQARDTLVYKDYEEAMKNVTGTVNEHTLDESPFVYKDIFEVMALQEDSVEIIDRVIPLINVKDDTPSKY